ncbi:hypothetical protein [Methylocystis iwaonis]|uniref:hypothetical protein n=1 Tax=Methylocystis iwaonis TaxID=2885079 RepID=UPI002E7C126E|nr:hypothetical protein [Methylocystis iwaonis]
MRRKQEARGFVPAISAPRAESLDRLAPISAFARATPLAKPISVSGAARRPGQGVNGAPSGNQSGPVWSSGRFDAERGCQSLPRVVCLFAKDGA